MTCCSAKNAMPKSNAAVYGTWEKVKEKLQQAGQKVNTAFIERLNRTWRAHVPGLGRREEGLAKTEEGLERRAVLVWGYYNFCLLHASLREDLAQPIPTKGRGSPKKWKQRTPAMAAGLTDHRWTLRSNYPIIAIFCGMGDHHSPLPSSLRPAVEGR